MNDKRKPTDAEPLQHDEDPRYHGTDPHDTYPGERPARPKSRQRTADGGGAKRGSPASRESRRQ